MPITSVTRRLLRQAGLPLGVQVLREPDEGVETTQQACLMARKPADISRP
ncbi:hypothetical protein ACTPOK_02650 [Streptomyces inhibens]